MINFIKNFIFIYLILNFLRPKKNLVFDDLNFRKIDFTNYKQVKSFIFKENFYKMKNKYVQNFDFLNFSKNLGGKIGINLSRNTIFKWYKLNKNKIYYPWTDDLVSKRLINLLYNYEYINSSSTNTESKNLNKIIFVHIQRNIFEFNKKKISEINSFDILGYLLSNILIKNLNNKKINFINHIIFFQVDKLGVHKSYNLLEHAKFINNLNEIKNIYLYFNNSNFPKIENLILKMTSILNQYFHDDGTFPLFNGTNNNYTKVIFESLNKDVYLKSREFINSKNGIAFYSDKGKKVFFDIVQPNKDKISSSLSAGTLSFEFSGFGEKIITNCGASESLSKNPEYLRYSAAHSTIILQNTNISEIKEDNPHIRFPQSVIFNQTSDDEKIIWEGSHNGYLKKFNVIIKRKIIILKKENKILGEDLFISLNKNHDRIIFHTRFHLTPNISSNFTNNKKNIILRTKSNHIWLFKSDMELIEEDSIIVDNNSTELTKQIVLKGIINKNKIIKKWSIEKT